MLTKVCNRCGTEKPVSEFSPNKGGKHGVRPDCKPCASKRNLQIRAAIPPDVRREREREYTRRQGERRKLQRIEARRAAGVPLVGERITVEEKRCRDCGEVKPASEFQKEPKHTDGLRSYCRACIVARQRDHRRRNPNDWNRRNPEKIREYGRRYQERKRAQQRQGGQAA